MGMEVRVESQKGVENSNRGQAVIDWVKESTRHFRIGANRLSRAFIKNLRISDVANTRKLEIKLWFLNRKFEKEEELAFDYEAQRKKAEDYMNGLPYEGQIYSLDHLEKQLDLGIITQKDYDKKIKKYKEAKANQSHYLFLASEKAADVNDISQKIRAVEVKKDLIKWKYKLRKANTIIDLIRKEKMQEVHKLVQRGSNMTNEEFMNRLEGIMNNEKSDEFILRKRKKGYKDLIEVLENELDKIESGLI